MTKQIKLADVFFEAANNQLSTLTYYDSLKSPYSCIAIAEAVKKLAGEKERVTDSFDQYCKYHEVPSSERCIHYSISQWSKVAKAKRPVMYAALKFAKEAGCPTGSSHAMQGVNHNKQQVRYQWLMTLAMIAEEENAVVQCN